MIFMFPLINLSIFLGVNSHVNYLPMFAGIDPDEASLRFMHGDAATKRSLAETLVANTTVGTQSADNKVQSAYVAAAPPAVSAADGKKEFREPWLFDLAEIMGYETLSGE